MLITNNKLTEMGIKCVIIFQRSGHA